MGRKFQIHKISFLWETDIMVVVDDASGTSTTVGVATGALNPLLRNCVCPRFNLEIIFNFLLI